MFQFIRKHQAIGLIFIGIVIVSFVIFFSPNQGVGGATMPRGALGSIRGEPIEMDDYRAARKELHISQFLRERTWPASDREEETQILNRLFLLDEAKRLGIEVTDEVAAARIVEMLRDEQTSTFNRAAYDQFLAALLEKGITQSDFEDFMRHEVALQHLVQLGGMSGTLIPPREAEARFREGNDYLSAQLAVFSATNHLAEVNLSPTNVAQYYTNRMAEYRIPERVQVRYVKFAATNFLAEADQQLQSNTNLTQILEGEYQRRGPDTFRDAQGNPLPAEAAKEQMKEEFRLQLALDAARKKAVDFANRLYRMEASAQSLNKFAEENNMPVQVSLPFDQFRTPADMKVPSTFNQAAFKLTAEEPFATPVVGEDGVYIFAFERRVPSEIQPLELVRNRVVDELRRSESRSLAEAAGRTFAAEVTNAMAQGKSFEAVAAEAGHPAITVTNFSRSSSMLPELGPRLTVGELLRAAEDLKPGEVSGFIPAGDGGFVLHLTARNPVPDDVVSTELPEFLNQSRQFGRYSSFMEWQRKRFAAADVRGSPRSDTATNAPPAAN